MQKFIKLIFMIIVFSNVGSLFAITVFDKPVQEETVAQPIIYKENTEKTVIRKAHKKKCICPTLKKSKSYTYKKSNKKVTCYKKHKVTGKKIAKKNKHHNKLTKKHSKIKAIHKNKSKQHKVNKKTNIIKKEKPKTPLAKNNGLSSNKKEATIKDVVKNENVSAPLVIVNAFEEDPLFMSVVKGNIFSINKSLNIIDVSNKSETKNLLSQSYKLLKASSFWDKNTVFISGSSKSKIESTIIVAKSNNNQFFVTQNSGVLTFIEDTIGISEVRELQRANFDSKTLNGRDVEYLIATKLINNPNSFNNMGEPISKDNLAKFSYTQFNISNKVVSSLFVVEDKESGDIFTFIPTKEFNKLNPKDNDIFKVTLSDGANIILDLEVIYKDSRSYTGGNQASILNYKNNIGSYIALKNIQNKLPSSDSADYKVSITPLQKAEPIDISNIEGTDSVNNKGSDNNTTNEANKLYPYAEQPKTEEASNPSVAPKEDASSNTDINNNSSSNQGLSAQQESSLDNEPTLDEQASQEANRALPYVNQPKTEETNNSSTTPKEDTSSNADINNNSSSNQGFSSEQESSLDNEPTLDEQASQEANRALPYVNQPKTEETNNTSVAPKENTSSNADINNNSSSNQGLSAEQESSLDDEPTLDEQASQEANKNPYSSNQQEIQKGL